MRENMFFKKIGAERLKLLAVMLFFLLSGIWYSHSLHAGRLVMGEQIAAEELAAQTEDEALADKTIVKCNINTATAAELTALSGIGEKKAADIIAYREANGNFSDISDIMRVPGIGEKIFAQIKTEITVEE